MGKYDLIIELVKKRFEKYQTYYQTLGVDPNALTDDIVKEAYEEKSKELKSMLEVPEEFYRKKYRQLKQEWKQDLKTLDKSVTEEEIKSIVQEEIQEAISKLENIIQPALDDAYNALKDENSRKHYKELLDSVKGSER